MTGLALLLACEGTGNLPPIFTAVNGREVFTELGQATIDGVFEVEPGGKLRLEIDAYDPDGDTVWLAFPMRPPGLSYEARAPEGVWEVPEDYWATELTLYVLALDTKDHAQAATELLALQIDLKPGPNGAR